MIASLTNTYDRLANALNTSSGSILPTLARFVFAATLLIYFWGSAHTKWSTDPLALELGAYIQIFPKAFEAAGYDASLMPFFSKLVIIAGTVAEYVLPLLIIIGLFTRFAALGMIGFVIVQTYVDIFGHGVGAETIGTWFDNVPDSAILDQRAFWALLLITLVLKGGGPLSVDRLLTRNR